MRTVESRSGVFAENCNGDDAAVSRIGMTGPARNGTGRRPARHGGADHPLRSVVKRPSGDGGRERRGGGHHLSGRRVGWRYGEVVRAGLTGCGACCTVLEACYRRYRGGVHCWASKPSELRESASRAETRQGQETVTNSAEE